ncbi:MAG: deoxyribonuclease IV [Thermodesulfovibrionales bacterium]|nr:deoxyribonuclease IV [Thermodesulfovibrionales bacterium]
MQRLGVHCSIAGGIDLAMERAKALGCTTIQIFSHNPRNWARPSIPHGSLQRFKELRKLYDIEPVFIHCSYLINIASEDRSVRRLSTKMLLWELETAELIRGDYLILHPGSSSHNESRGRERAKRILKSISELKVWGTKLLLENTAGERGDISSTIEDLAELLEASGDLGGGICLDTCHAFQAGYDLRKKEEIERLSELIKKTIGQKRIKVIHLNDSKKDYGAGVDRHEHIGKGKIGEEGFRTFLNHPDFRGIPIILETPKRTEMDDVRNLKKVKNLLSL